MADPARHAARHARAVLTTAPRQPAIQVREYVHEDGRHSFPDVAQYVIQRWDDASGRYVEGETVDLPPTADTHPDEHAQELARQSGRPQMPCSLPYRVQVHDLAAYERLKQLGALDICHRIATAQPALDERRAPGS